MHVYTLYAMPFVLKRLYLTAHTLFRDLLIAALSQAHTYVCVFSPVLKGVPPV